MPSPAARYARAFAEVAERAGLDAAAAEQQMRDFAETLAGSGELREFLETPSIEIAKKLKVLDAIAARMGMPGQVRNFIAVILEHHRLSDLGEIVAAYCDSGVVEARITSARALNDGDRAQLEAQIAGLAGAQVAGPGSLPAANALRATYVEDASLLGGVIVEIGSTIYDGSVRGQLQQLKQRLVNA